MPTGRGLARDRSDRVQDVVGARRLRDLARRSTVLDPTDLTSYELHNVEIEGVRMCCMDPNLGGFIRFLEDHGLVEFDIVGKGDRKFTNRLKLQKYAFLAKRLGMPFHYRHAIYLYGPYSSELAADYYALARGSGHDSGHAESMPGGFRKDDFLKATRNDPNWLEIAATIIDRNEHTGERAALMEKVCRIKSGFDREFIADVLGDLEEHGLVSVRA